MDTVTIDFNSGEGVNVDRLLFRDCGSVHLGHDVFKILLSLLNPIVDSVLPTVVRKI